MNKLTKKLLVASLVTLTGIAQVHGDTNKTHLTPRPAAVNLAMEKTTWHTQIDHKYHKEDDKFGASIVAVPFAEFSTNKTGMGKYFGFNNMNGLTVGTGSLTTAGRVDRRHLIHNSLSPAGTLYYNPTLIMLPNPLLAGNLNLEFSHRQGGVHLYYRQALDGLLKGLYFQVSAPIVWSQTRSRLNLSSSQTQSIDASGYPSRSVADYFSGNITQTGVSFATQTALNYSRITGNRSKTALSEIPLKLGWNFWVREAQHAGINIGITFPTGPKSKSVYLFEPLGGGNGQHWGLGAGIDTKFEPWKHHEQALDILLVLDYRYLFKNSETRTLQLGNNSTHADWSRYFLVGHVGTAGVQPLANISTGKCDVTPGNQVDFLAGLAYKNGGFTFDLGYNLYGREREKVSKKFSIDETAATGYALAGYDYNATSAFALTNAAVKTSPVIGQTYVGAATGAQLLNSDFDTGCAQTPAYVTHKIYGGIGYCFNRWETPLLLGLGADFEFASKQKALEQWGLWGKVGISF
ncbi:TPA: hypothetical protein DEO28_03495 [Candidatus Dependentiae bacterium]|nr:MAG: hypothetical protein UR43_C0004G0180 [candidate division TM6 bacterium GW2011_GWF2_33_332]HBS48122.1 hypothetical protein [Candidatus Dependentiae bacterium]HBZ73546.1 hypothetical protein [Candidatus Dependentiae bacterium]